MKLSYPEIKQVLQIREGKINSLVIENPTLLYNFIMDLKLQTDKQKGKAILSENDEIIEISKKINLVTDIYALDVASKTVITKLIDELDDKAMSPEFYESSVKIISEVQKYVDSLTWDMDCDVVNPEISIKQILKSVGLTLDSKTEVLEELIFKYTQIIELFLGKSSLCF